MNRLSPRLQIILSMLIFGTIGVFRRWIPFPSSVISLVRSTVGLFFLLAVRFLLHKSVDRSAVKRNLPKLLVSGAMLGINWILLFEAYNYTSVAAATMCYYMAPVFIILISAAAFGEKLTLRKGLCAAAAVFGMLLVSGIFSTGFHGAKGLLFGLAAAALYALIVIINRMLREISAEDRTIMQFAVSSLVMLPYVLLTEDLGSLQPTAAVVLLLLLVGILHTGIAYVLYFGSVSGVSAQTAALLSYIDPVVAVLLSVTLLKESMNLSALFGAALVIAAMIISEIDPAPSEKKN